MRGTFATSACGTNSSRARRGHTRSTCRTAKSSSSTTPRCGIGTRACRSSSSPVASTARGRRATGRRRGTALLGVRAVIAESYERIHRSNLVGMGVLPLEFLPGDSAASLGLTGRESFAIDGRRCQSRAAVPAHGRRPERQRRPRALVRGRGPPRRPDRRRLLPPRWHPARRPPWSRGTTLSSDPKSRVVAPRRTASWMRRT